MKKSYTLLVLWTFLISLNAVALPKLSSHPSAQATIFLDFDGQIVASGSWNSGNPINCAPSGMTDAQITEAFNRVSEDYRPFNVNITTDEAVFLAAPLNRRMRIIITPTSSWYPSGVGGIAYTGSFTWGDDTPAFVFSDRLGTTPKYIAECSTHESGHTLGLSHQAKYSSTCSLVSTYNDGSGTGVISWAPVMGNSYYKNMTGWNNGPTPSGCTSAQDNLSIITTQNGFSYRTDDYSDDAGNGLSVVRDNNNNFSAPGIINTTSDKDALKFAFATNGRFRLDATPYSVGANFDGANLDIKLILLNSARQQIAVFDPPTALNAIIDTTLNAGLYYVMVQGAGNANATNYGSLGSYTVSGNFSPTNAMPIRDVALTGKLDKNNHNLNWNIISDEPIKTINVESSTDGRTFTTLSTVAPNTKSFTYSPTVTGDLFYRLKVTSVIDQTVHSNVITLKSAGKTESKFKISTLVHDEIMVNASATYQYSIADMSGRIVARGANYAGINRINISNTPNGMYVMYIISNNETKTEQIVKQ
ncbi:MAG TPA: zinc-dependent metalloprotease [Pedobacter sp.]|jgi:hypothetical protein